MDLLFHIAIFGLIAWLIDRFIPMAEPIKTIFRVVLVVLCIGYLLQFLSIGLPGHLHLP